MSEILAHGLLWLDVLRDYHGSIRSHNFRRFVTEGGLISFGIDQAALYRLAASYVDRILKRRETSRPPGAGSDEIRNRAQHQDCQSTRLGSTAECVCPCRRGDRMKLLLHLLTSLHGTKRTCRAVCYWSAFGGKADTLLGAKRTTFVILSFSAFDPNRTLEKNRLRSALHEPTAPLRPPNACRSPSLTLP